MFKFLLIAAIAFLACGGALAANPQDAAALVVKQKSGIDDAGNYNNEYETSNRISAQEKGVGGHWATGSYAYYSPEGQLVQLSYLADENGFQPSGTHIPTPPPVPQAILRALEYIRTHPQYIEK